MKRHVFIVFSLVVGFWARVSACSCFTQQFPFDNSSAIFIGHVEKIDSFILGLPFDRKVTFKVNKRWKGPKKKRVVIQTTLDSPSCGFPFVKGKDYLVVIDPSLPKHAQAGVCSGTQEFGNATIAIQKLNEFYK